MLELVLTAGAPPRPTATCGVTFVDTTRSHATARAAADLARTGGVSTARMVSIRQDVECPSLSPDKTRRVESTATRLLVAALPSDRRGETLLAEARSA
jgi:hypothetical protein